MSYHPNGSLTTDKLTIDDSDGWDTQTEWEAYQSANDVVVNNGVIELAQRPPLIDNFETDPDGPYASDSDGVDAFYGGDLSQFTRSSSIPTYEGTYALQASSDGPHYVIGSTTGLDQYPAPGDNFAARVQMTSNNDRTGPFWAVQSESGASNISGYQAWLSTADSELILNKWENGGITNLAQSAANYPQDEWLDVQIGWGTDGSIQVTVLDSSGSEVASVSATDSTFTSGGIGWHVTSSGSSTIYFDEYRFL